MAFNWKKPFVGLALKIVKAEVLDKIDYAPAKGITTLGFDFLQKAAEITIDDDKDNKTQLAALWQAEKTHVLTGVIDAAKDIVIEEVNDTRAEGYIVDLLDEVRKAVTQN